MRPQADQLLVARPKGVGILGDLLKVAPVADRHGAGPRGVRLAGAGGAVEDRVERGRGHALAIVDGLGLRLVVRGAVAVDAPQGGLDVDHVPRCKPARLEGGPNLLGEGELGRILLPGVV